MCVVYGARHLQLENPVAVKVLRPQVVADALNPQEIVDRFLREGVAASRIGSEHVVRTFDVGTLPSGHPFLVMEFLDGHDLDALLSRHGPLPIEAAVDYVLQAGEAIAEAHGLGIVHRDLKPANLFLTQRADGSPCVKVLDFGISKLVEARSSRAFRASLTGTANILGSPHYMSPEQLKASRDVDQRTDIWSLGAILQELLSGEPPFKGETMPEVCANILKEPPQTLSSLRTDVPDGLADVVLRCLEKEPRRRFQNMGALASALSEFATPSGKASAHRIVGTIRAKSVHPPGDSAPVLEAGRTWGTTDPSWDAAAGPSRARRLVNAALVMLLVGATGALLTAEFAMDGRVSRYLSNVALAHRAHEAERPGVAAAALATAKTNIAPSPLPASAPMLTQAEVAPVHPVIATPPPPTASAVPSAAPVASVAPTSHARSSKAAKASHSTPRSSLTVITSPAPAAADETAAAGSGGT